MSSRAEGLSEPDRRDGPALDPDTMLREAGAAIAVAVDELGTDYLIRVASAVADAWGGVVGTERARLQRDLEDAAARATRRVAEELRSLLAEPAAQQRMTPLELVRTLPREPTEVLHAAGIPAVVRQDFDERTRPEDRYDLVPRSFADLGDPELGHLHLAWGVAKARVLRKADNALDSYDR